MECDRKEKEGKEEEEWDVLGGKRGRKEGRRGGMGFVRKEEERRRGEERKIWG